VGKLGRTARSVKAAAGGLRKPARNDVNFETIILDVKDGIATVTLNQPQKRNAMTVQMGEEFLRAVGSLGGRDDLRVMVLTGSGRAFCAGGSLDMIQAKSEGGREDNKATMISFYRRFLSVLDLPFPTIAAINGYAIGAGLCFALACDIRLAAEDARMGMNFVRLGLHPGMGATYLLPRLVGASRACELFFTGELVDGREAARLGLVNRAVPAADLPEETARVARRIAANAPAAVRGVKRGVYHGLSATLEDVFDYESTEQAKCFETADFAEGISAMIEKREPRFTGR
jgi:enoyl-CoA hydratase/carnithine racemase